MYAYNSHELFVTRRDTYRTVISDIVTNNPYLPVHSINTDMMLYISNIEMIFMEGDGA
jgi:hypothetical protein